jgi:hypothetical protein
MSSHLAILKFYTIGPAYMYMLQIGDITRTIEAFLDQCGSEDTLFPIIFSLIIESCFEACLKYVFKLIS